MSVFIEVVVCIGLTSNFNSKHLQATAKS